MNNFCNEESSGVLIDYKSKFLNSIKKNSQLNGASILKVKKTTVDVIKLQATKTLNQNEKAELREFGKNYLVNPWHKAVDSKRFKKSLEMCQCAKIFEVGLIKCSCNSQDLDLALIQCHDKYLNGLIQKHFKKHCNRITESLGELENLKNRSIIRSHSILHNQNLRNIMSNRYYKFFIVINQPLNEHEALKSIKLSFNKYPKTSAIVTRDLVKKTLNEVIENSTIKDSQETTVTHTSSATSSNTNYTNQLMKNNSCKPCSAQNSDTTLSETQDEIYFNTKVKLKFYQNCKNGELIVKDAKDE